jgi:hypothetical protein
LPDRLFWIALSRFWSGWKRALLVVQPETVIRWHRAGFNLYWKWISRSRARLGRKPTSKELRELIFCMVAENPTWGAPRIHGELKMLGFGISERTVLHWMRKAPRDPEPARRWAAFLANHREIIAAMDFFTVPTLSFGVLYCFFVIAHGRRQVLHFKVMRHPTSAWVSQQFVGSCRRDLFNHVIVLNERHLKRLMAEYVRYYHDDRTHLGLAKETPVGRKVSMSRSVSANVVSMPRLGGLHHRYNLAA